MKRNARQKELKTPAKIALATLVSVISMLIVSFVAAVTVNLTDDPLAFISIGALAALLISSAVSAFIVSRCISGENSLITLAAALIFSLIFIAISLIASGGKTTLGALLSSVCYVAISLLIARIARAKPKRKHR